MPIVEGNVIFCTSVIAQWAPSSSSQVMSTTGIGKPDKPLTVNVGSISLWLVLVFEVSQWLLYIAIAQEVSGIGWGAVYIYMYLSSTLVNQYKCQISN